jgi:hypothetical protein
MLMTYKNIFFFYMLMTYKKLFFFFMLMTYKNLLNKKLLNKNK